MAVDFGVSNTDIVWRAGAVTRHESIPSEGQPDETRVRRALAAVDLDPQYVAWIAVTGGNRALVPSIIDGCTLHRVEEVQGIGRGGLAMAQRDAAVVVSAGSGTAVIAATRDRARHVTGTGVGGGTLLGLSRLLIGTVDPTEIDALSRAGTDTTHNLMLHEVLGEAIGSLPVDTTAVNFGRVARHAVSASREDTAAALVNMVGQVIAVIAINATRAEQMTDAVIVGHLADMPSVRHVFELVAQFYGASLLMPEHGGAATALGALLVVQDRLA
ncbi:MAG TPA: Fumble domain-containing protein [Gemmatimonas aurantiaca]|uniref:Fumble domain-containing protein n=1 Tax=Gemmatimonas aurantiaca TaxID=173480 RepID=A0A3D4VAM9_9BACT|nr:hypothetical protein [Gemmatimonas aurantiaca]HCT57802.1 Fumble domain-containing protein [Gemmatimonas aurantiaca]